MQLPTFADTTFLAEVREDPLPDAHKQLNGTSEHENAFYNQMFNGYRVIEKPIHTPRKVRIVTIGAGVTGITLAKQIEANLNHVEHQIYEKNEDVGGTWWENRYPGCKCDIPSHTYQFTWAPNSSWSSFYATRDEIWKYAKQIVVEHKLDKYIQYNRQLKSAIWDEESGTWKLEIEKCDAHAADGKPVVFGDECHILINACGILNKWKWPALEGIENYKGELLHTAKWNEDYNFSGKNIAVIGNGSSAVQIVPTLQPKVESLVTYFRSPTWITTGFGGTHAGPEGNNFDYTDEQKQKFRDNPDKYLDYRLALERELNSGFRSLHLSSKEHKDDTVNMRELMMKRLNHDARLSDVIIPDFPLGCRRPTPGIGYLESLRKDNVKVITDKIAKVTTHGILDSSGKESHFDAIICATGFDTGFVPQFTVRGREGIDLNNQWAEEPKGELLGMEPPRSSNPLY